MLTEHHIPNRQSGTFYQLCLATAVYQWSILQQHSEHFVRRCILSANAGAGLADIKNWPKICPVVGITITLWGFRNEVRTNCQHQALVWVRKDEFGRLLTNQRANRIESGTRFKPPASSHRAGYRCSFLLFYYFSFHVLTYLMKLFFQIFCVCFCQTLYILVA